MARSGLLLPLLKTPAFLSAPRRLNSSRSGTLIGMDLESSTPPSTSSSPDGDVGVLQLRKLEEAIHMIFVKKSTPDWLPFVPGSSFWVPPRKRPVNVAELIQKLSEEETLPPFTSGGRGCWPSLEFLTRKDAAPLPAMDLEEEVKVTCKENESGSGDSEG